jgi:hypothetical protein
MSIVVIISRSIVATVGAAALLLAGGNLITGGGSMTDPVMPFGLLLGALTLGAAAWTTAPERWRAVIVWLGVLGVLATFTMFMLNLGQAALRDVLVYFGIPAAIVLAATAILALARARAGALGNGAL